MNINEPQPNPQQDMEQLQGVILTLKNLKDMSLNEMSKDFRICGYEIHAFDDDFDEGCEDEELKGTAHALRLSIEIEDHRYFFQDIEAYKAFKTKFNLL